MFQASTVISERTLIHQGSVMEFPFSFAANACYRFLFSSDPPAVVRTTIFLFDDVELRNLPVVVAESEVGSRDFLRVRSKNRCHLFLFLVLSFYRYNMNSNRHHFKAFLIIKRVYIIPSIMFKPAYEAIGSFSFSPQQLASIFRIFAFSPQTGIESRA